MKFSRSVFILALSLVVACATRDQVHCDTLHDNNLPSGELDNRVDSLAGQIISTLDIQKVHKIAVVEFSTLDGNVTDLGKYLAEELTGRFFRTGTFQIVERQLIQKVMEEQKLSATGLVDEKCATKLGQILGVDALATGTVADLNSSVKINARLISPETGSVLAVATITVPMNKEVETLLSKKSGGAFSSDPKRFDGIWDVNVACRRKGLARGYTIQLSALVKDGVLHGQYGQDGIGPNLTLDGKINPDGSTLINAKGLTGASKYSLFHVGQNTPYFYHVEAHFSDVRGTGKRIENRVATLTFVKQ